MPGRAGGLHDPDLLLQTVATCLGLPGQEVGSQADAIVDYLRGRQLLLILDSCEHLIGVCAKLAEPVLRYAALFRDGACARPLDLVVTDADELPARRPASARPAC